MQSKSPKPLWLRTFLPRYLNRFAMLVAGGFERPNVRYSRRLSAYGFAVLLISRLSTASLHPSVAMRSAVLCPSASIVEMRASTLRLHSASFLLFGVNRFVKTILNRF